MTGKRLSEEEFKAICKEAIPHIEALREILKKRDMGNLGSLTFDKSGYTMLGVYDTGWVMSRVADGEFRIRHEIGLEG